MLASGIIVIAALGTLNYHYLCVRHIRFAQVQLTATRIGQLVIEDWKSTGGRDDYEPEYLGRGFEMPAAGESARTVMEIDNIRYYIDMSHADIDRDDFAGVELRQINVTVRWRKDFDSGALAAEDPGVYLSTYVRRDQD
jgi:hypothetical protein